MNQTQLFFDAHSPANVNSKVQSLLFEKCSSVLTKLGVLLMSHFPFNQTAYFINLTTLSLTTEKIYIVLKQGVTQFDIMSKRVLTFSSSLDVGSHAVLDVKHIREE